MRFPFMFGVYPYTTATDKQKKAMELAHVDYVHYSIYEITESFVTKLLQNFSVALVYADANHRQVILKNRRRHIL